MSSNPIWPLALFGGACSLAGAWLLFRGRGMDMQGFGAAQLPAHPLEIRQALRALKKGTYCAPVTCKVVRRDGRRGRCPSGFRNKTEAVDQVLDANPGLADWIEKMGEPKYRAWVRAGRIGPKPFPGQRERELDAFDNRWNLRGRNQVGTWTEALYRTMPSSRKWRDLPERLAFFEETVTQAGLRRNVAAPNELTRLLVADQAMADCLDNMPKRKALQQRLARLKKRRKRVDVPF